MNLYRHFNKAGELLYVGISLNSAARLTSHANSSGWFSEISTMTVQQFPSRAEALAAENFAVQTEKPKYNASHSSATKSDCRQQTGPHWTMRPPADVAAALNKITESTGISRSKLIFNLIRIGLNHHKTE